MEPRICILPIKGENTLVYERNEKETFNVACETNPIAVLSTGNTIDCEIIALLNKSPHGVKQAEHIAGYGFGWTYQTWNFKHDLV